nr:RecName: Full=Unknown protein 6 [Pinus halepensis]
ARVPFYRYYK